MRFDQESKDLLRAARQIEQRGLDRSDPHPLRALSRSLQYETRHGIYWAHEDSLSRYHAAAGRFMDANGLDNMDLSAEEAVDSLVAAAFWEIP